MLQRVLLEASSRHAAKTALVYGTTRIGYGELAAAVAAQAGQLQALGLQPADCVVIILPNCPAFVVALLATATAHMVALPLNPLLAESELAHTLEDSQAALVITDQASAARLEQLIQRLPHPPRLLIVPETPAPALRPASPPPADPPFGGLALYQYSSGSTGRAKRVGRSQANLLAEAENFTTSAAVCAEDVILCVVPLFHAHGLGNCLLAALRSAATLVILEPARRDGQIHNLPFAARVAEVLELIATEGVTILPGVPQTFAALADATTDANLATLRLCFSAGNNLPRAVFEAFFQRYGLPVRQLYGCTEVGSLALNLDPDPRTTWDSVGRPLGDNHVQIVDEQGAALAPDTTGELLMFSRALTEGYSGLPEVNAAAFRAGGFLSGDLGHVDAEGRIFITGRKRLFIDTAGYKINPIEVEDVLAAHPAVAEVAVVGVPGPHGEELVKAFVVAAAPCSADELLAHCRAALADFKVPRALTFLDELPRSPLGKLLRKDLLSHPSNAALVAPDDGTTRRTLLALPSVEGRSLWLERYLREQIAALLRIPAETIELERPLTSLGLNSVGAIELCRQLEQALGLPLSPTLVWNHPSIAALAAHLAGAFSAAQLPQPASPGASTGQHPREPIAIIGMACRFPGGANDPEQFWQLLLDSTDAISEVPAERWDLNAFYDPNPEAPDKLMSRWGGFLGPVDAFDAAFFGISPREAAAIDPQQRLLLEVAWEALERAGLPVAQLAGSPTGVFVGIANNDYFHLYLESKPITDAYLETGNRNSFAAGRLSYLLDLRGPSVAIDTVCSSSLAAVHLACQSLRSGDSDLALAGGVNLIVSPLASVMASKWGMLTPDGRCKTFDARANGFVRSEGCGMVVLKRLSDAQRDGDPILAVIRGSAINQDGKSAGLTAPNGQAQQALIRRALDNAAIDPAEVQYVETHGTGTSLGDPIEVEALAAVYGRADAAGQPCFLGALKTNIGHLEAAAGVAGLIKTTLGLRHGAIPANLHLQSLNPHISLAGTRLALPNTLQPWPASGPRRYAGVSSFGFSGTNVHVLLEDYPAPALEAPADDQRTLLLPISARSTGALQQLAQRYSDLLAGGAALRDLAWSAGVRRSHHSQRLTLRCQDAAGALGLLEGYLRGETLSGLAQGEALTSLDRRLVWVFPGQGSQWLGMGRRLMAEEPHFRQALEACEQAFQPFVDWSLLAELEATPETSQLDQIDVVQPTLFAIQVSLAALWQSWGLQPAAVVGHSMGEVAAAHVAGILTLDDAARIICRRSQLMRRIRGQGAMLLVELSAEQAEQALRPYADRAAVAVCNSARSTVCSGDPDVLEQLRASLDARGVFCRWVKVDVASHSPQVDPLAADLLAELASITPGPARLPFRSTVTNSFCSGPELTADYWVRNLRNPVLFGPAIQQLASDGLDSFLEISSHPALLIAIKQNLQECGIDGLALGSLQREASDRQALLDVLAELYVAGATLDWAALLPQGQFVAPPAYPWQRQHCWVAPVAALSGMPSRGHSGGSAQHPLLGTPIRLAQARGTYAWAGQLDLGLLPYLADHRVQDVVVLPATAYLEIGLASAGQLFGPGVHSLNDVQLHQVLVLREGQPTAIQIELTTSAAMADQAHSASLAVYSRPEQTADDPALWTLHASMTLRRGPAQQQQPSGERPSAIAARCPEQRSGEAHYRALAARGLAYGPRFQGVQQIWRRPGEALAQVALPGSISGLADYAAHPALLDACLQVNEAADDDQAVLALPVALERLQLFQPLGAGPVWVHAIRQADPQAPGESLTALTLLDDNGHQLLALHGLRTRPATPSAAQASDSLLHTGGYLRRWQPQTIGIPESAHSPSTTLIFADRHGLGQALAEQLAARADTPLLVVAPGASAPSGALQLRSSSADDYQRAIQAVSAAGRPPCRDVIYLWDLDNDPSEPERGWQAALLLAQTMISSGSRARLWLVTRGAQAAGANPALPNPNGALLWGLGLTIAQEHPELRCTRLDLDERPASAAAAALLAELDAPLFEDQLALRPDGRYVARLARWQPNAASPPPAAPAGSRPFQLAIDEPGVLDRLTLRAIEQPTPGPGEVAIAVEAAGLNFLDVLLALGAIPESAGVALPRLGGECAGRIVALGPGVSDLAVGQAVVAIKPGSFSTTVTVDQRLVAPMPAQLSFAEAATLPIAFLTAYHSLVHVARLQPGERVLIHAAAGGVGLAALQIAKHLGAEIYATAGSPAKRAMLAALGVAHVFDSRSLGFADELRAATGGAGVDVVLNSLAGEFIDVSLELLRPYGRFIELGKRDYFADRKLGLKPFLNNLSFALVDLRGMQEQRPALVGALLHEVMGLFASGVFRPILHQTVPVSQIAGAFQTMAGGRHTGKIAISFAGRAQTPIEPPSRTGAPLRADRCYLISGGLGGIGLRLAGWLAAQGARHLALLGRSAPSPAASSVLEQLRASGVSVTTLQADLADPQALAGALARLRAEQPALGGVFHAAAVLDDATLPRLDAERFRRVLAPKVAGAWHLHQQTQDQPLEHFVLFSSVAALLGSPGQANYAAGNAVLDALAQQRWSQGLPALSINWGAWAEVGLAAAQSNRGERLAGQGITSFTPDEGLAALGELLGQPAPQVGVVRLNLRQWQQAHPAAAAMPLLRELGQDDAPSDSARPATRLRDQLEQAAATQRRSMLETYLREQVALVLRLPASQVNQRAPLGSIGFDSLLALELRNRLEASLDLVLPGTLIWSYPTINALTPFLAQQLGLALEQERPAAPEASPPASPPAEESDAALTFLDQQLLDDLADLSDEEVRRMLAG